MSVRRRGGVWWVDVSHGGRRARVSAGKGATKGQALELERKLIADIHAQRLGRPPPRLIADAILRWLDGEARALKSRGRLERHAAALLPYTRGKMLTDLVAVAEDARAGMLQAGLAPATVKRRLEILRRIGRLAERWGWLEQAPHIGMPRENNARHVYLTPAEVDALARACPRPLAGVAVRLLAATGLRKGELLGLDRRHLRHDCIVLDANTKGGRPRLIPVPAPARPLLEHVPLAISEWQLDDAWKVAREATAMQHVHLHDLRHTYASWLVQAGVSLAAVRELLGHSTLTVTQRYAHLAPEHLRDAVGRIEKQVKHGR